MESAAASTQLKEFDFYIEGVHCSNCLTKIESLNSSLGPISSLNFNMSDNHLSFKGPLDLSPKRVIDEIDRLGFKGRPYTQKNFFEEAWQKENRSHLIRLGVAAVCAGNIMMLASSVYSGAEGAEAQFMNWISFGLILPVLFYVAWPFYRNAWFDLKQGRVSVDMPIVLALVAGFVLSTRSLILGKGDIYFDSMASLCFLILASRYFLRRVQSKYMGIGRLQNLFHIHRVPKKQPDGNYVEAEVESLSINDCIRVDEGQVIPIDGKLLNGIASLDTSVISGEARPRNFSPGDDIFMGMKNCGDPIEVKVTARLGDSRLNRMLQEVEAAVQVKPRSIQLLDRVGQAFLFLVLGVAALTLFYFWGSDLEEGARRSLALILVACPCTFAFGAPLVFSLGMVRAARDGLLVKHPSVFEKLKSLRNIVFDKTGTLTDGRYALQEFKFLETATEREKFRILSLLKSSEHPVSRSLRSEFWRQGIGNNDPEVEFDSIEERPTQGLFGYIGSSVYKVDSHGVSKDGIQLVSAQMGDQMWPESKKVIDHLRKENFHISILSGDKKANVDKALDELGLPRSMGFSEQSPEMKTAFVEHKADTILVGDGANDSLALAKADVGVAVNGSLSSSLRASDVYLMKQDLRLLVQLLELGQKVRRVIRQNLATAVLYNLVVGVLAIMGYIHPLLAAVLMPLSGLTQLASALRVLKKETTWT